MNNRYSYGASETLKILQNLYEKKIVSYPRTDTNYIGTPEFNYLKDNLKSYLSLVNEQIAEPQLKENKRYVNSKKVEEHYAIIPTRSIPDLSKLSDKERNIYKAILYRTLAIFEKPYIYDETIIITNVNSIEFKTTGKIEKVQGYKRLLKDNKENKDTPLPSLVEGNIVSSSPEHKEGKTTPPKYYTEGTLITAMKNIGRELENEEDQDILKEIEGIGTEATRANVIDTLKLQKYIKLKGKNIMITDKGNILCETLEGNEITNAELTAEWEKHLKRIRENNLTQEAFLGSITRFIEHLIEQAPYLFKESNIQAQVKEIEKKNEVAICPKCNDSIIDKGKFYGCSNYPDCEYTLKKKLTKTNINQLLKKNETVVKSIKSKSGNIYNAKVKINNNNYIEFVEFVK